MHELEADLLKVNFRSWGMWYHTVGAQCSFSLRFLCTYRFLFGKEPGNGPVYGFTISFYSFCAMEFACTLAVLLAVAHATPVAPTVPSNLNDPQVWKSFGDSYYHFGSATTGTFDAAGEFLKFRNAFS